MYIMQWTQKEAGAYSYCLTGPIPNRLCNYKLKINSRTLYTITVPFLNQIYFIEKKESSAFFNQLIHK